MDRFLCLIKLRNTSAMQLRFWQVKKFQSFCVSQQIKLKAQKSTISSEIGIKQRNFFSIRVTFSTDAKMPGPNSSGFFADFSGTIVTCTTLFGHEDHDFCSHIFQSNCFEFRSNIYLKTRKLLLELYPRLFTPPYFLEPGAAPDKTFGDFLFGKI